MISKNDVLAGDWQLLRIEIAEHDNDSGIEAYDGYSRFWCKQAVLGAYWVAEKVEDRTVRIHLTEDIELEGFREKLSFRPDRQFKRELLAKCNWDEVVRQVFHAEDARQLSLFDGGSADTDEEDKQDE